MYSLYYDRAGKPIDVDKWAEHFENLDYKILARDVLDDGKVVSTIWVGLDQSYDEADSPVIFETIIFTDEDWDGDELYMNRYSTEAEALEGHKEAIEVAKTLEVHDEATD
jgi:hypothetical protein